MSMMKKQGLLHLGYEYKENEGREAYISDQSYTKLLDIHKDKIISIEGNVK